MIKKLILITLVSLNIFSNTLKDAIVFYNKKDFIEARKLFEEALNKEDSLQANYFLGKMYLFGQGIKKDPKIALKYIKKAAERGNLKAKCLEAKALFLIDRKKNETKILEILKIPELKNLVECKNIKINKDKK